MSFSKKGEECCSAPGLTANRVGCSETIRALGAPEGREGTGDADIKAATSQFFSPRTSHTSEALLQLYLSRDK